MYVVRRTKTGGFVLSSQKPKSVLGKMFFPGDKFQLASLTQDPRGGDNVITDPDAVAYLNSLKRGDNIGSWVAATENSVVLQDGTELKRKWAEITSEEALVDAIAEFTESMDAVEEEVAAPKAKARAK